MDRFCVELSASRGVCELLGDWRIGERLGYRLGDSVSSFFRWRSFVGAGILSRLRLESGWFLGWARTGMVVAQSRL